MLKRYKFTFKGGMITTYPGHDMPDAITRMVIDEVMNWPIGDLIQVELIQ